MSDARRRQIKSIVAQEYKRQRDIDSSCFWGHPRWIQWRRLTPVFLKPDERLPEAEQTAQAFNARAATWYLGQLLSKFNLLKEGEE